MDRLAAPFPGMDPFLEEPALWSSVHTRLMNSISDQLAGLVAPDFYVEIQQHVTLLHPEDDEVEISERFLEVRDRRHREVITIIEVLSPWNKSAGPERWDAFQAKRHAVMAAPTHWLKIDLLRAGKRPPEVAEHSDYYALLKRGATPGPYEVWYIDLRDPLPTIAVPLRHPYGDVPLDLQAVLTDVYRRARYAESLDLYAGRATTQVTSGGRPLGQPARHALAGDTPKHAGRVMRGSASITETLPR